LRDNAKRLLGIDSVDSLAPTERCPPGTEKRSARPRNKLFFGPFTDPVLQKENGSYSQALSPNYTPVLFPKRKRVGDSASRQTGKHSAQPQGANRNLNNTTNTMSVRVIPFAETPFVALSTQCVAGATALGAELDLQTNNAATVSADQYDYVGAPGTDPATAGKRGQLNQKRQALQVAQAIRRNAINAGRSYNERAVDHLKGYLGRSWNNRWVAAGFTSGSLQLPSILRAEHGARVGLEWRHGCPGEHPGTGYRRGVPGGSAGKHRPRCSRRGARCVVRSLAQPHRRPAP
jgi:hypothetical protein